MNNFEKKIKNRLLELDMTIQELASKTGLTKGTIHNIFNTNDARMSQLEAIANVLGVSVNFLIGNTEEQTFQEPKGNYVPISKYNKVLEELVEYQKTDIKRLKNTTNVPN